MPKFQRPTVQHLPDAIQCWRLRGCQSCLMAQRARVKAMFADISRPIDYVAIMDNFGLMQNGLGGGSCVERVTKIDASIDVIERRMTR